MAKNGLSKREVCRKSTPLNGFSYPEFYESARIEVIVSAVCAIKNGVQDDCQK